MGVDLTLRLGDILTLIGLFGGGAVVVLALKSAIHILAQRMDTAEVKLDHFGNKLDGLTKVISDQARHDERLRHVEEGWRDMQGQVRELQQQRRLGQ